MALSSIVCEMQRVIGRKSRNFYTPPAVNAPALGDPVGISRKCLYTHNKNYKTKMIGLPCGEKKL